MAAASRRALALTIFFYGFVSVIWLAWTSYPVFADGRRHPLAAAYFFDQQRSPGYELVYLLQAVSLWLFVPSVCGFDTTAVSLLLHASAQFRVLLASLRTVRCLPQDSRPTRRALVRCVRHHAALIKYVNEFDEMFRHIMLCQFLYSTFIIALCGFQIIESSDFAVVMKFLLLGISFLFEMFLFCKSGDDLLHLLINSSYTYLALLRQFKMKN